MQKIIILFSILLFTISCEDTPDSKKQEKTKIQQQCNCTKDTINPTKCDTTFLSNNAILYWKFSCKEIEYQFQHKTFIKTLKSGSHYDLINRIGPIFVKEYDDYLFFVHEWISGCCTPPDLVFLDKNNGSEMIRISNNRTVLINAEKNYLLYFKSEKFTDLIFHNLEKNIKCSTHFKEGLFENAMKKNSLNYVNELIKINESNNSIELIIRHEKDKSSYNINNKCS